jgi:outer membrane protein assembly factor BamB
VSKKSQQRSLRRRSFNRAVAGTVVGAGLVSGGFEVSAQSDTSAGEEIWSFRSDGRVHLSSPTVVDGTVYFGSNDDNLYAVDASSGEGIWNFTTDGRVRSSPTVVDGTVYFGSNDDNLYAVDASSGEEIWSFTTNDIVRSSPTVVDGILYVGSNDDNLYAVDASSGEEVWSFTTNDIVSSSPTVVDDKVYFGSHDGNLYAVDASSGEELWSFTTDRRVHSSPTVVDGTVYVGSHDGNLYAVDVSSGEETWSFTTGDTVSSSPTVVDGTVYVGSHDGNLYAVDASSGEGILSFTADNRVHSSPTVVDDEVYFGSHDSSLYAVDASSGEELWSFEEDSIMPSPSNFANLTSSPTVMDGTVYFGSHSGNLYAVETGVSGYSEDSRVMLGTLGHHDEWKYAGQSIETETETDTIDMSTVAVVIGALGLVGYGVYSLVSSDESREGTDLPTAVSMEEMENPPELRDGEDKILAVSVYYDTAILAVTTDRVFVRVKQGKEVAGDERKVGWEINLSDVDKVRHLGLLNKKTEVVCGEETYELPPLSSDVFDRGISAIVEGGNLRKKEHDTFPRVTGMIVGTVGLLITILSVSFGLVLMTSILLMVPGLLILVGSILLGKRSMRLLRWTTKTEWEKEAQI